ncbi:tetratricopeptide (TPR) repeat protein [Desulfobaculum xiamenense]|uniref:Tetratricopeptide (TPR) repeat protein n=1 Tax=Desulfobaculum xiamenense TaxID=995050 RepID=A0A846QKJ1_9BACT|nr:tetratricopeptide repeat protein [Desulfobaculum xiamenense]NJB69456.1 tetratricopeptide (TPR) repeat protein [Desulfobaculum xiamenense]
MTDEKTTGTGAPSPEGTQKPHAAAKDHKERIKGVFSSQTVIKVGTGTTTRKTIKKTFWFVDEDEGGELLVQPLNVNYVPSGAKRKVPRDEFLEKFAPEPEFYVSNVFPKMRELKQNVENGEKHREKGETFSAELEFNNALNIDEENVRANFGLGLTYLERGDDAKANDIFERLVKLDAAFEPEHKHLFNEFGINLRKNRMYDQSVDYYTRALELSAQDEHLFYNIARVHFEQEDWGRAAESLAKALELNPEFAEAQKFMQWLKDKNLVDENGKAIEGATMPDTKKAAKRPKTDSSVKL